MGAGGESDRLLKKVHLLRWSGLRTRCDVQEVRLDPPLVGTPREAARRVPIRQDG